MRIVALAVTMLLPGTAIRTHASEFARADIYFVPWLVESVVALASRIAARGSKPGRFPAVMCFALPRRLASLRPFACSSCQHSDLNVATTAKTRAWS